LITLIGSTNSLRADKTSIEESGSFPQEEEWVQSIRFLTELWQPLRVPQQNLGQFQRVLGHYLVARLYLNRFCTFELFGYLCLGIR